MHFKAVVFLFGAAILAGAAEPAVTPNAQIQEIVSKISPDHIAATQKKLESFETRNIYSATSDPAHGIGAAREWIAKEFQSYSPRLEVRFDKHRLAKQGRAYKDVEIWNVVAVLRGTMEPEQEVMVSAHYDTINVVYRQGAKGERELDPEGTAAAAAPGVTDDGSGVAAVLELARVMSAYQFRKTIVFVAFAAEEYGLFGSGLYAEAAQARHEAIEGVFNNDIIGSDTSGNGAATNRRVNVYSEGPEDSASRELARYLKEAAERYEPGFEVTLVFRHDRFARGGDHSPFNAAGIAAIRITTPSENFSHQHTATDTFANTAPAYTALVAKANAAGIASLAMGPKAPVIAVERLADGRAYVSSLKRGSGYDAAMSWQADAGEQDLAGYYVRMRSTTAPLWEKKWFVGKTAAYVLPDVNIDEVVLGVQAVDSAGNESLVTPYVTPAYTQKKIVTY